jgi:exodeoxyribonuclease III
MRIISWNVNGLRAVVKKNFNEFLEDEKPDILCLQETKISSSAREKEEFDFPGYEEFLNPAERPGYSGTATLIKPPFVKGGKGDFLLSKLSWDDEGRVQTAELEKFYIVNCYFPNANHELSRLKFKINFNDKLLAYLKKLEKKKPVIICGDFNVAHQEIDLARPKDNIGNAGFTPEEREWMTKFLNAGFVDTYRYFYPENKEYTWWSYRFFARAKNLGWRIDYFCVSKSLIKSIKKPFILKNILGSDHCPVGIEVDL